MNAAASKPDPWCSVEAIWFVADDPDVAPSHEESEDPPYQIANFGCSCCSSTDYLEPIQAREAAQSLLRRLEREARAVRKLIKQIDARAAQRAS